MAHKILAIDDHPETLSILVATLKRYGYRVVFSRSPFKGLQLAESEVPDLLLVDMNMPEMNGVEVVRRVRALPALGKMPIIMFTAEDDIESKKRGFAAGVDDYILKPTEPAELIGRVEALLEDVPDPEPQPHNLGQGDKPMPILTPDGSQAKARASDDGDDGKLIVLMGSRGGVGTTTVAINLACVMARLKRPTILADFDLQQGHISLYLNQKTNQCLNEVAEVATQFLGNQLPQQLVQYGENLQLLLARPNLNGRFPVPTATQLTTILEAMIQPGNYVIADLGLTATDTTQPILDRADHVIVCLGPERVALAAARRYVDDIQNSLFFHTMLHVLMCDMNTGMRLPRQSVEKYMNRSLLGLLSIPRNELIQASNKGMPLVKAFPQSNLVAELRQVAGQLMSVKK